MTLGRRTISRPDRILLSRKILLLSGWLLWGGWLSAATHPASPGITFEGEQPVYLSKYFHNILPGKKIRFRVNAADPANVEVQVRRGILSKSRDGWWVYTAPAGSGTDIMTLTDRKKDRSMHVTFFVLTPRTQQKGAYLNGYRIGNYPVSRYKDRNIYDPPEGFIEVSAENKDLYITPHFRLGQFLCKQASDWPKYLVIQPTLLVKLEYLITGLEEKGIRVKTLFIMSGYRTPYYNHSIGNVKYSRHVYGDASDIYVDEDHDHVIDDLNHDGKHDMKDAKVIYDLVNNMDNDPQYIWLTGGLGRYGKTPRHTWFVHVDTRGYKARW